MTLTIELPDEMARKMTEMLPEGDRRHFAISAIENALLAQEQDSEECMMAVEEGFAQMDCGRTVSLEEEIARWQSEKPKFQQRSVIQ